MNHYVSTTLVYALLFSCAAINASEKQQQQQTFIVSLHHASKPPPFSTHHKWYTSTLSASLGSSENTKFIHVYNTVFNGFSARLTIEQSEQLKNHPSVLSVWPDTILQLHTTRSIKFLGLNPSHKSDRSSILTESDYGADVIIGVIDTGIWPERRSFHDEDLGPIPSRWKGECIEGENFTKSHCNKKIIGARYFLDGYEAGIGGEVGDEIDIKSARDSNGHGTHTASTAAGRAVSNASFFGFAQGVAVGVAPKARIAVYKVCWVTGCFGSDVLAAFDKAIEDGVDVISISVGGGSSVNYKNDPIAMGAFAAAKKGIFVSASAGNSGPKASTVDNSAPWITTVGASTIDRKFPVDLVLGDGRIIKGTSVYAGKNPHAKKSLWPIVLGEHAALSTESRFAAIFCDPDSLDGKLVKGKIVVCYRGGSNSRLAKGKVVKDAGGVGLIVANMPTNGEGLIADPHFIPGVNINASSGIIIRVYVNSTSSPEGTLVFHKTQVGSKAKPAPVVASFSSRGPSTASLYVLKPDLIAPGVNILAAWPANVSPSVLSVDRRRTEFNVVSGTSMSCPHLSGIAALLKGAHPDWSPAMIRSALMTTAYTRDRDGDPFLDEKSYNISTIWDMGAGHVDPNKAVEPGLVYDLTVTDYFDFLCAANYSSEDIKEITATNISCKGKKNNQWDLNYPAIAVTFNASEQQSSSAVVVKRTVTYVSEGASTYIVKVEGPKGTILKVNPQKLHFKGKGEKQSYTVLILNRRANAKPMPSGNLVTEVGKITWTDRNHKHSVISPVIVTWK